MTTTQAPDAPRLVPDDVLDRLDDMMCDCKADGSLMLAESVANEHGEDLQMLLTAYRKFAAAPAVQPAAGREGIANHDCLAKRRPGEPMFILLGRDPDAHNIVRLWAERRLAAGGDPEHCQMGLDTAERMAAYAADPANRPASAPDASDYPAISTPAQASETGGDMLGRITQALVRADEEFGNSLSAYRYRKLAEAVAALSAPQAAPGEGEQS